MESKPFGSSRKKAVTKVTVFFQCDSPYGNGIGIFHLFLHPHHRYAMIHMGGDKYATPPKILLSGNQKLQYYVDAVNGTDGIAVAKCSPNIDTDYDGLILCGGNDIDPAYYGEGINGFAKVGLKKRKALYRNHSFVKLSFCKYFPILSHLLYVILSL